MSNGFTKQRGEAKDLAFTRNPTLPHGAGPAPKPERPVLEIVVEVRKYVR